MSIRQTPFLVGQYYHIYNRGNDKRVIFLDNHEYARFMALLYICNTTDPLNMRSFFNKGLAFVDIFSAKRTNILVDIGAYCLMPNHFHLLLHEQIEGGISIFMQKLSTAYSMYFNTRYERNGSLFEGKFKAKHIDNEPYFNWLFSYIHLNPIKIIEPGWKENGITDLEKTKSFLSDYPYSSYSDYFIKERPESVILQKDVCPEHFKQLNDLNDLALAFKNYHT
ncbi:MAG: transposase [Candidatus Lloydbacteria bacterium]|nr:transposase [Candidatus Lloydbacteria bacterium]